MTAPRTESETSPTRIDKALFEAGSQCAKRLYLEAHSLRKAPADPQRAVLSEVGEQVTELARKAFPGGKQIEGGAQDAPREEFEYGVTQTRELLESGAPALLFDACFESETTRIKADIVLAMGGKNLDIFEVKAGSTVKQRHLLDVALQIHTIEAAGYTVQHAMVLHLDGRYEHDGGKSYPVKELFKHVDVTARARKLLDRVGKRVDKLRAQMEDEVALELPMGTWCTHPLPCPHFESCLREAPPVPLVLLPDLTPEQEAAFHEDAVEEITQLDPDNPVLQPSQRRAVRAILEDRVVVEPFVPTELADVDEPICYLHVAWHVEVLPRFEGHRPWQKLPFAWAARVVMPDGSVEEHGFAATDGDDPRFGCVKSLAELADEVGTIVTYQAEFDRRMRRMIDEHADLKPSVRRVLDAPYFDLARLIQSGAYAPGFRGAFDVASVYAALAGKKLFAGMEINSSAAVSEAARRIMNSRTRAKTREALGESLVAYCDRVATAVGEIRAALME